MHRRFKGVSTIYIKDGERLFVRGSAPKSGESKMSHVK